jgi:hypothetical protein
MKIAFTFTTNEVYYVALEGTKIHPVFSSKDKISLPSNHDIPETVAWFETQLSLILDSKNPVGVAYKLTINNVTNNFVSNVYYGQAILNLLCHRRNISITYVSPTAIVPSKFNQPKETDLLIYIDGLLGKHPPYWVKEMKKTALISLIQLP